MIASDIITHSEEAIEIAKKYGGKNWREVYQESWLALREQELSGKKIERPISYFFFIVKNKCNSKKKPRTTPIEKEIGICEPELTKSKFDIYDEVVQKYISKDLEKEEEIYYQQFCELLFFTGFKYSEFKKHVDITRQTFWRHVKELKKILENELKEFKPL